ncbi:MAG: hypothetical protein HY074_17025 [Deltaproteobacteria bacterium]|nr:hypothetical protein [Deltaproteobacteria bacterium]
MPHPFPRPVPIPPPPHPVPPREELLLEGELKPYNSESLPFYFAYTIVVEAYHYEGYPDVTMTLYPRVVCNQPDGCPDVYAPPASTLEVRNHYMDNCDSGVYEAFNLSSYADDITDAVLMDSYGTSCGPNDQLSIDVTHIDGIREQLVGFRTF